MIVPCVLEIEDLKAMIKTMKTDQRSAPGPPRDDSIAANYKQEFQQLVAFRNMVSYIQLNLHSSHTVLQLCTHS